MRRLFLLVFVVFALSAGSSAARSTPATLGVYPSGTTFTASGAAPAGAASSISLAMPIGGVDDATILVRGAQSISAAPVIDPPLQVKLFFAHYVSVDGTPVPDALMPWDGSRRAPEHVDQPLWVQVSVPYGTPAGTYTGVIPVTVDGVTTTFPLEVAVSPVTLPKPNQVSGSLLTAFNFSPQSYSNKAASLYGVDPDSTLPGLFSFLASYRLSPNSWGYGNPKRASGYTSDRRWWLDKTAQMVAAAGQPSQFASMWIPISNNRWSPNTYVGGKSPYEPQRWCGYLKSVRGFWQRHGWLAGSYPYLYGMDEPGASRYRTVARQARVTHSCFPGSHVVITGKPTAQNHFLWNGGSDDVDVWAVLASRYYGEYTNPSLTRRGISHARQELSLINAARRHHKQIWTYTYDSPSHTTPGFTATEPAADPRVFADWAALEGISGLLYGQGTTTYAKGNPLLTNDRAKGSFVLLYPGRNGPIASARLEVLREGIEDWEILNVVRHKHGAAAVRKLLSGLFSTTPKGAKLGCTIGCAIRTSTPYSWPTWSHNAGTPRTIEQMRAAALKSASG